MWLHVLWKLSSLSCYSGSSFSLEGAGGLRAALRKHPTLSRSHFSLTICLLEVQPATRPSCPGEAICAGHRLGGDTPHSLVSVRVRRTHVLESELVWGWLSASEGTKGKGVPHGTESGIYVVDNISPKNAISGLITKTRLAGRRLQHAPLTHGADCARRLRLSRALTGGHVD